MSATRVGLLVIATGRYLTFADDLLDDLDRVVSPSSDVVVNLFTDAAPTAVKSVRARHRVDVQHVPVPELRWPEASLYRYELFNRAAQLIRGDVLVYLDADLRVRKDLTDLLDPTDWPAGMAAVRHPGFYRPRQVRPRGTWETRRASQAYVPSWRRRRYVCGGVWMGTRDAVLATSEELAVRVHTDSQAGVTARWHDESHWNWWVAHHPVRLLDPAWCWVPDYPWLVELDPVIEAVDKGGDFEREPTRRDALRQVMRSRGRGPDDR